jgi:hypothetical protein
VPYCQCNDVEKYQLKRGDILFARTGATTGKSFLVRDVEDSVFASYLIRLRVRSGILPEFLFWFFQSSQYWSAVGGGIDDGNRPNMNGSKLAELVVLFPESEAEQRRFVERVELLTSRSQKLRELNASLVEDMTRLLRAEYKRITEDAPTKPFSDVAKLVRRWVKTKPDQNYPETGIRSFGKGTFHKPALTGEQLGTKRICRIKAGDLVRLGRRHRRRAAGRRWPRGLAPFYDARSFAGSGDRRISVLLLSDRTRSGTNPGRVARFSRQKPDAGNYEARKNPRARAAHRRPAPVCQITESPFSIAAVAKLSGEKSELREHDASIDHREASC